MVAGGFGLKSYNTLFTPSTSDNIRTVILCKMSQSSLSTGRHSVNCVNRTYNYRIFKGTRPIGNLVDLKFGTTVKYCHTFLSSPARANSSRSIAVGLSHCIKPISCNSAKAPNTQTRPWKRLAVHHIVRAIQFRAAPSYLVLK